MSNVEECIARSLVNSALDRAYGGPRQDEVGYTLSQEEAKSVNERAVSSMVSNLIRKSNISKVALGIESGGFKSPKYFRFMFRVNE